MAEPSFWQEGQHDLDQAVFGPVGQPPGGGEGGQQSPRGLVLRIPFRVEPAPAARLTARQLREMVAGLPNDAEVVLTLEVWAPPQRD